MDNKTKVIETMRNNPLHGYDDWIKFSGLSQDDFIEAWNECIAAGRIRIL